MTTFNPIHRDYVAPADLATIERTYNTLEKGHQEAVRTASDLEIQMANLDLNEAESAWRQDKIDEIRDTIRQNTLEGNSYRALDDLILKKGDLYADQGMIGRLNAQRDYKTYQENLNASDLPEDYKNYYREANRYYYEDQVDAKGRIIGGTKWEPVDREVDNIDLGKIITQGINIAAADSGGGSVVKWLDENGNITTDANKAIDGQYFNTTTSQWTRLGENKIRAGIQAYIESTPGAKESLNQDYKIALWKHGKEKAGTRDDSVVLSDITDNNGLVLTPEEYLEKRISPAVYAAKYLRSQSNIQVNPNIRREYAKGRARVGAGDNNDPFGTGLPTGSGKGVKRQVTLGADTIASMQQSKANIIDAITRITGKDIPTPIDINDPQALVAYANAEFDKLAASGVTEETIGGYKSQLGDYLRQYEQDTTNFKSLRENYSPKAQEAFTYLSQIESGGTPDDTTRYGRQMINGINSVFDGETEALRVIVERPNHFQNLKTLLGDDIEALGYVVGKLPNGDDYIELPTANKNMLPAFAQAIRKANTDVSVGYGMLNAFTPTPAFSTFTVKGGKMNKAPGNNILPQINYIAGITQRAQGTVDKANQNLGITNSISTPAIYGYATPGEADIRNKLRMGLISPTEANAGIDEQHKGLDRIFRNPGTILNSEIYMSQDNKDLEDMTIIEGKDKSKIARDISYRITNSTDGNTKSSLNYAMANENGVYGLSITVPSDKDDEKPLNVFIPNFYDDMPEMQLYNQMPNTIATRNILKANSAGVSNIVSMIGNVDNSHLGARYITAKGNNNYVYNIANGNNQQEVPISEDSAININTAFIEYNNIKKYYDNGIPLNNIGITSQEELMQALYNIAGQVSLGDEDQTLLSYGEMLADFGITF
jgi:hypothetical protein